MPVAERRPSDRRDADSLDRKLNQVVARGAKPPAKNAKPQRTTITEKEVNAYFEFQGKRLLPVGVTSRVAIADARAWRGGPSSTSTPCAKSKERAGWICWPTCTGSVEIRAAGKLHTANGAGTFELESASIGGVPISKAFLQESSCLTTRARRIHPRDSISISPSSCLIRFSTWNFSAAWP